MMPTSAPDDILDELARLEFAADLSFGVGWLVGMRVGSVEDGIVVVGLAVLVGLTVRGN